MQRPQPEAVTLDDILITEELSQRFPRSPNLQAENQALHTLARQLVNQPEIMLQTLVDIALELCSAGTAGVSLLEVLPNGEEIFRWNVLAGTLEQYVGGSTPRNFSPWVVCLERGAPVLFSHPERYFTYFQEAKTPVVEGLVLPLIADNQALGSIWIMSHDEQRHFDAEDVRVMMSLADFTAATLLLNQRQTQELLAKNAQLEAEIVERKLSEERTHALIANLPGGAAFVVDRDLRYLLADGEALYAAGFKREDLVGKTIFEVLPPELAAYYEPLYRKALAGEPFEHEHHAHNHSYVSRGTPLRAENGEIYAVLAVSYDITERKQAEAALRESEARLAVELADAKQLQFISSQLLHEENIDALYEQILDAAIALMRSDMGSMQMLHPDSNELQLLAWKGFDPASAAFWEWVRVDSDSTCGVALNTGERMVVPDVETCEFMVGSGDLDAYRRSGIRAVQSTPLICRNGRVVGMISTHWQEPHQPSERELGLLDVLARQAADLIEQRQAEGVLRSSEARLQSIANLVPDLLWDSEPCGSTNWYNQRWMEYTGQTFEQAIGWGWTDAIHPDDREGSARRYREAVEQGMPLLQEHRIRRHDGAYRWFVVRASPLKDESGKVIKMYGAATDIHEQRVVLEALRESEEKFRTLANTAPALIWFNDAQGNNLFINQHFLDFTGKNAEQIRGEGWHTLVHPDDAELYIADYLAAVREQRPWHNRNRIRRHDGVWRWHDNYAQPLFNADGVYLGHVGVTIDNTDAIEAEVALRESEARLAAELADAEQLQFISSQLIQEENIDALYEQILEAAIALMRSDMGSMQMLHPDNNELQLLIWKGFDPASAAFWQWVRVDSESSCGVALKTGERSIIPDVEACEFVAGSGDLDAFRRSGIRAVQTTPLVSRSGRIVGMISTQWQEPHQPSERELGLLDVLARQAADLIEQRQAEAALRESEAKYRTLFETIDEGFALAEVVDDPSGQPIDILYLEANPAASRMTGVPDYTRRRMSEISPDFEPYWVELYDRVARSGVSERNEQYAAPLNRWYDFYVFPVEAAVGKSESRRVAVVFQDITDRKRQEAALHESEERLRDVLNSMSEGFALLGGDFTILDVNEETLRLDGRSRDELIGRSHWEAFPGTEDSPVGEIFKRVVRERISASLEHLYRWPDERSLWLDMRAYPTQNDGVAIFWRDVTDRKQAEAALRESEEKYRSLFNSMDEAFAVVEVMAGENGEWNDFLFLEVNPAFVKQTGMEYPVGRKATELLGTPNPRWAQVYGRVAETGEPIRFEEGEATLGRVFDLYVFRLGGEGSRRVAVLFTDITDRKRAEVAIAADLRNTQLLRDLGARLITEGDIQSLYQEIMTVAITLMQSDAGTVQILDEATQELVLLATQGFEPPMTEHFYRVDARSNTPCGRALAAGERIFMDFDVPQSEDPDGWMRMHVEAGYLSAQSTPLISRSGKPIGMVSTHWCQRYRPSERELRFLDLLVRQAADLIEQRQAEAALRESEAKYRSLFDSIDAGFCIFEMLYNEAGEAIDFRYIETNPAFEQQSGRRPQPGQTMRELFPEAEDMWLKDYAEVARTGQAKRFIDHHKELDRWFDVFVFPSSNGENQLAALFSDVTEEKRAEAALRESEERLQKAISIETVGVLFFTLDGHITDANDTFLRMSGYSRDELRTITHWQDLTPPEFWDVTSCAAEELATLGKTAPYEKQHLRKDGSRWWGLFSPTRLKGSGRNAECVEFVIDISDRKCREANLAFLAELAEDFSRLSSADEIMRAVGTKVGTYLNISTCLFVEVNEGQDQAIIQYPWHTPDTPDLTGVYRLSDFFTEEFRQAARSGETIVIRDTQTDPRTDGNQYAALKMHAFVSVPFHREGEWKYMFSVTDSVARDWREDEIELIREMTNRTFPRLERAHAEVALHESEQKYRTLFDSIDEGLAITEIIYDDQGEIVDIIYRQVNRAYERHGGVYNVVGRSIFDVIPGVEDHWLDLYKRVARIGESVREENYQQDVDRWFDVYFSRVDDNGHFVAIVFSDISDRKRREAILRENQERQAFLLKLSDILQQFVQPNDIKAAAMRLLGEHLGVSRAQYHECDSSGEYYSADGVGYANGLPLLDLKYRIDAFGTFVNEDFAAGRLYRSNDLTVDPRVSAEEREAYRTYQIRAGAGMPLIRGGKLVAILAVHDVHPHPWTDLEMDLIRETAERICTPLERARAQEALRESEEKYRSLFTSIDEGVNLLEMIPDESGHPADFRIVETNPAWERQTGLTDAVGKTLLEIAPDFEQQLLDFYSDVVISGRRRRSEYYTASVDRWYTVYASRIGGEGSRQVAVVFNDISDRKQREREQEFLLKLGDALKSLSDAVEIQRTASRVIGEYLDVDRAYYADIDPDDGQWVVAENYVREGVPPLISSGRIEDFGWAYEQMRAGKMLLMSDVNTDENLSESARAEFQSVNVTAAASIPLVKAGRWVASFTLQYLSPHEWSESEIKLAEETVERTWAAVERAKAEAAMRESELQRVREQSAREEERQRAEALAELDRAKTLFFSNVSHEFRTPLTLSLAPLQDALSDQIYPLVPPQRERVELAHRNAFRLLKLVNTLLDFSRIEAGRMEAVYEATDLALLTTELASVFRSAIERAGLQLIVDCPPLPEPVYVDREMWEKIVLNLVSNAFKFTFAGEIAVRLHPADDHHVTLQVQDTGTGIAPEELPHLFERFYQVRGAKARTHEGSGIGLALVHELIRLHGGTVDVSSTVGQGTCFTATIPLGTAHLPSDRIEATRTLVSTALGAAPYVEEAERWLPEEKLTTDEKTDETDNFSAGSERFLEKTNPTSASSASKSAAHILLVDDNGDMRDYLTRILSEHVEVIAVADGAAALAAAQERVPDLVLSDVMMPQMDGFELLKALRAEACTREVPIILLSARAGEESVIEGLQAGADDYLIKPFSATELVTRVLAHLQMAQLRGEVLRQERSTSRRKDEMLSIVSHELNTPLVAILGWTRLLRTSPVNQSMLMKSLETIERNATLQAKLISDLLDISRITAGKVRLQLEPVELQSVISTAIASVNQTAQTKDIELSSLLEPLPIIIQGDPERLQQIILNLLTNAVKFTPQGGRIEVCLDVIETQAQIKVSDTGCGIAAEFLPYVFDHFRQGENSKSTKGLGLGLAIARHLVELHGGTISAESLGVGQGATFIIKFPLIDANS